MLMVKMLTYIRQWLACLFCLFTTLSFGQHSLDSFVITPAEQTAIRNVKSTFYYSFLADSFARHGDSVNASAALLKVSPYELIYEDVDPDTVDRYVKRRFKATHAAAVQYTHNYKKVYTAKKSPAFTAFKLMFEEDQAIRLEYEKGGNRAIRAANMKKMMASDSAHFDYLFKYVRQHGWPALADGAQYASVIAIHDHGRHSFYFPLIKKAALKGETNSYSLVLMMLWQSIDHDYDEFQKCLEAESYVAFDVTSMFDHKLPATLPEIERAVEKYCPSLLHLEIIISDSLLYDSLRRRTMYPWLGYDFEARPFNIESTLEMDLVKHMNCEIFDKFQQVKHENYAMGMPIFPTCKISDEPKPRLVLYITYCHKDDDRFNSIITDKKLITHAIHFDVNKATIKPASLQLLERLAAWLKKNQRINLEIAGHTDSDGTAADNLLLSQQRADEVKRQLVVYGVNGGRLTAVGYGSSKPIQTNGTFEGKQENRRVEFIYMRPQR